MIPDAYKRLIVGAAGLIFVVLLIVFGVSQCDKRRSAAAQSRVERSQADAASNSAAEAINTVASAGKRESDSEELTRSNEKDIRNAPGAQDRVNYGVNAAGLRALCLRDAYRNDPRCRVFKANP